MDQPSLESTLADLNLPAIRFYPSLGSTNEAAWQWCAAGAPHAALVVADEQTAGRGRFGRKWITVGGSSLAFSLVLRSPPLEPQHVPRLTGLGALAVCQALHNKYALPAQIKWPNDILLNQRKTGGILVETRWGGEIFQAAVIGIGINIARPSIDARSLPAEGFNFPATCLEDEMALPVDRLELLHAILAEIFNWFGRLCSQDFITQWEGNLAYLDQWVGYSQMSSIPGTNPAINQAPEHAGKLIGLTSDGSLKVMDKTGKLLTLYSSEIQIRPNQQGNRSMPSD